jgi:beta-lactamase class A
MDPAILNRRTFFLLTAGAGLASAAPNDLEAEWRAIAREADGTAGAAALHLGSGRRANLNGDDRFPLASVCKLPIAMAVLEMVSERRLSLGLRMEIPPYDVWPGVSPIAERWPKEKWFRLDEMVELMIEKSDNTAVQTLFRAAGRAVGMGLRMKEWGIDGMRLDRDERTCGLEAMGVRNIPPVKEWTPHMSSALVGQVPAAEQAVSLRRFLDDPRDTATPNATLALLQKLYGGKILPGDLTGRLRGFLEKTTTGKDRIKGLLPPQTVVAHKTGTTADAGDLNGSTNDVGVITLPNRSQVAVAFYLKGSTRPLAAREAIIARMARAAYDWALRG